jgi:hypothetical protein
MGVYVFAKLITGESIIGIQEEPTRISKTVIINIKPTANGGYNTELSAVLPFQPSMLPTIDFSRLLCEPVPVIEEHNVELINVYNQLIINAKEAIKTSYVVN